MSNLIKKVQNTIFEHNLFPRGSKIILACSGGPDSTALLDIFSKLQKKYDLELAITHMNYGLRGKDSDKDEQFVKELARKHNLKFFVLNYLKTRHAASLQRNKNIPEDALRKIRYDFFEKTRYKLGFDFIATAHTLDDQVETFLMRILRGSGLLGLSGISYKNGRIIRPLLNISKDEILNYLKENELSYRVDKTNLESKFTRNKIRNRLIPYLEKNFNPWIKETIFNAAESIGQDYEFISAEAWKEFKKNKILSVKKLLTLPPSLQHQVLILAILEKKTDLKDIESAHIRELLKVVRSTKNKSQIVLFKGLKASRKGDRIIIENN